MQFKNLAEEMTEKDLKEVLEIIYPDTIFSGYKRMEREIKIFFKLHGKIRSCVLMADQVVDMPSIRNKSVMIILLKAILIMNSMENNKI